VNPLLVATGISPAHVTYPLVVVEIEGINCRALLDTGVGSSHASATLLDRIPTSKRKKEIRKIEMLFGVVNTRSRTGHYQDFGHKRKIFPAVEVSKVDKGEPLSLENPNYQEMIAKYPHLPGSL